MRTLPLKFAMDYSAVINTIRVERLDLVEFLAENRLQLVATVTYISTTVPLMVQDVAEVLGTYRQLQEDVCRMINDLDRLEQKLTQRIH